MVVHGDPRVASPHLSPHVVQEPGCVDLIQPDRHPRGKDVARGAGRQSLDGRQSEGVSHYEHLLEHRLEHRPSRARNPQC